MPPVFDARHIIDSLMSARIAAIAAAALLAGCRAGTPPTAAANLLVVTLDTTRADRLGAYGDARAATPAFDRVARDGVLFEQAITAAPLTLPAHATIFTARFPPAHGVRDNGGFTLDGSETTLAERLKAAGFRTGGFVSAFVLDRRWGIAQGFDTYVDDFDAVRAETGALASIERPGNEAVDRALSWLEQAGGSRFFAWVHLFDAHSPYAPPEPYRRRFANDPYAGEIAFADAQLARLIDFLERRDLLRRTVVVVAGDHGESLGEHGERTHGFFVYQAVVRVPLAILAPRDGLHGRRVGEVVRTVDIVPTVLDLLDAPAAAGVDGTSLVPLMTGAVKDTKLEAYSESLHPRHHFGWSGLHALRSGRYKYIEAPRPELYDIEKDPGETDNLIEARRPLAGQMAAATRAKASANADAPKPAAPADADTRARLSALGYVGTFAAVGSPGGGALADPKDKIDVFNLITRAREELEAQPAAAIAVLQRVVRQDPQVIDAWLLLGNAQSRRRDFAGALASYKKVLELEPDYDLALINLANVYRDLGRPGDALIGLRRLLEIDSGNVQARQSVAEIAIAAGRLDEAERELAGVLERDPRRPLAHFNLAVVAEQRGDLARAESEYRTEIEHHPDSYMAHFNLGKLYERKGDRRSQLAAYEAAVRANPSFAEGHLFLSKVLFDERRLDAAVQSAKRGLELQPDGEWSPLGHFVLADVLTLQGHREAAAREMAEGKRLANRRRTR